MPERPKENADALGLMKMNQIVEHEATPAIWVWLRK